MDFIFLQTLQKQKSKLDVKLKREKILVAALPETSLNIIEIAKQHGRVTVSEASNVIGVSRNTIIKWQDAADDVKRFLKPVEQKSLNLWSERFYMKKLSNLEKLLK